MDRRREHNKKRLPCTSEAARLKRAGELEERRREQRDKKASKFRDIEIDEDTFTENQDVEESQTKAASERMTKLMKWKAERSLQKKILAQNKKAVFKIGVPHHNFYSPKVKNPEPGHCHRKPKGQPNPAPPATKITRATERRLAAKAAANATALLSESSISQVRKTPIARSTRSREKAADAPAATLTTALSTPSRIKTEEMKPSIPENNIITRSTKIDAVPLFGQTMFLLENSTPKEVCSQIRFRFDEKTIKEYEAEIPSTISSDRNQVLHFQTEEKALINPYSTSETENAETADSSVDSVALRVSSECLPSNGNELEVNREKNTLKLRKEADQSLLKLASPVAAQYSPFVCTSRGKSSARKEMKKRMSIRTSSSPTDDIPTKETVMQNLNISVGEEENTAQYYRSLAQREEDRLREICQEWEKMQASPHMIEEGVYHINSATGQANLLIRKKFGRFLQLVGDCETGKGERLVRCRDLQGFWELIAREISDCDSRFSKLHTLKNNNWVEEEIKMKPVLKKKTLVVKKKTISASSKMRDFIDAQRRKKFGLPKKMEIENDENETENQVELPKFPTPDKSRLESTESPRQNPKSTPRTSPFRRVQLTESAKKLALASIQIAQSCKTPEVQLDQSISYINSDQTPGRGILKKSVAPTSEARLIKSAFKVNFNDAIATKEVAIDEDAAHENNPAAFLRRTSTVDLVSDSNDMGESGTKINKKLNFEDGNSFDSEDDSVFDEPLRSPGAKTPKKGHMKEKQLPAVESTEKREKDAISSSNPIPNIEVIPATPATRTRISPKLDSTKLTPSGKLRKKKSRSIEITSAPEVNQSSIPVVEINEPTPLPKTSRRSRIKHRENMVNEETPRRMSLRNRSIVAVTTPQDNQSFKRDIRNDTDLNVTTETIDRENNVFSEVDEKSGEKVTAKSASRRESTRKSTKVVTEDDCSACSVVMPATPMTPRRKRKMSVLRESIHQETVLPLINGDLMSFDSPAKFPTRSRRKSMK